MVDIFFVWTRIPKMRETKRSSSIGGKRHVTHNRAVVIRSSTKDSKISVKSKYNSVLWQTRSNSWYHIFDPNQLLPPSTVLLSTRFYIREFVIVVYSKKCLKTRCHLSCVVRWPPMKFERCFYLIFSHDEPKTNFLLKHFLNFGSGSFSKSKLYWCPLSWERFLVDIVTRYDLK